MPDLVLEKGGQTHRFKLHEDKSVTNGKSIYIPFNGRDYYARYGDTPTPLEVEIKDIKQYVQYEPADFKRYYWERTADNIGRYSVIRFFPKGRYRVILDGYNDETYEFSAGNSGNRTISLAVERRGRFTCTISGLFAEHVMAGNVWNKLTIERIGD